MQSGLSSSEQAHRHTLTYGDIVSVSAAEVGSVRDQASTTGLAGLVLQGRPGIALLPAQPLVSPPKPGLD